MPDSRTELEDAASARACARRGHDDCPHIFGIGGGFNPQRLRPEFGAGLCSCSCHTSCPLTRPAGRMMISLATWHQSCTCPGAEDARRGLQDARINLPDSGGLWEHIKHQSHVRQAAFRATKARSTGKTREEIRDMYVAELHAGGLEAPSEPALDATVDAITSTKLQTARMLGETIIGTGKGLYRLVRLFSQGH